MTMEAVNDVLPILESLDANIPVKEAQKTLQDLLKTIPDAIDEITLLQGKLEMRKYSPKIRLCSSQIAKALPHLCRLISSGTDPAFKDICHYLIAKLRWCLSEIVRISSGGGLENDSEASGLFIQSIDKFVNYLNEDKKESQNVSTYIDELLCHALTIAKMAENEDYNEITAACRIVLASTAGVTCLSDVEKIPLKKDMILCSLVNLERKVNIAVLRLFLYVTSKFLPPLKNIIKKSGIFTNQNPSRQPCDIDQELQSLDFYYERVQLIGNYAVACSECKKQKLKVECSLASLEFLADYIIPAAESFYMDPSNLTKRRFLQYLTDECIDELKNLTNFLDNIIDTPAFFQVLQEDLSQSIPNLKIKFSKGGYDPQESNEIITKCYKVISHLKTTDDPIVRDNPEVLNKTKELLDAVKSHGELIRDLPKCNAKKFNENLDKIIQSVEDIDEYFSYMCMSEPQRLKYSHMQSSCSGAVSSTPFTPDPENGFGNSVYEASTPSPPNEECQSLDPFLNKIFETPVIQATLYNRTPYKSLKKGTPRNLSFDISEVLESLEINYSRDEEEEEEAPSNVFTLGESMEKELEESVLYGSEMPDISIVPPEFHSVNTLRRNLDINFLENKIKQLTTNEF